MGDDLPPLTLSSSSLPPYTASRSSSLPVCRESGEGFFAGAMAALERCAGTDVIEALELDR